MRGIVYFALHFHSISHKTIQIETLERCAWSAEYDVLNQKSVFQKLKKNYSALENFEIKEMWAMTPPIDECRPHSTDASCCRESPSKIVARLAHCHYKFDSERS